MGSHSHDSKFENFLFSRVGPEVDKNDLGKVIQAPEGCVSFLSGKNIKVYKMDVKEDDYKVPFTGKGKSIYFFKTFRTKIWEIHGIRDSM